MKKIVSVLLALLLIVGCFGGCKQEESGSKLIGVCMQNKSSSISVLQEEALVQTGVSMLRLQVAGMVFMAVVLFTTIIFQATGKTLPAMVLSLSRQGVVFLVVLLAATYLAGYHGILMTQVISDLISAIIIYLCGFVLFMKYVMNTAIAKREEKAALKAKEAAAQASADKEGGDQ